MKSLNKFNCVLLLLTGLVVACSSDTPSPPGAGSQPNIVLVTIDAFRPDKVGAYGNTQGLTPHIDSLAERGVVFEHALAPIATTFPSHATMLTGLYPLYHGVRWNGHSLDETFVTVPELLQQSGYDNAAFVSYKGMLSRGGLHQGFNTVSDQLKSKPAKKGDVIRDGQETTAMAVEWLQSRQSDQPFMLWVHLFEPHSPHRPSEYSNQVLADYDGFGKNGIDAPVKVAGRLLRNPDQLAALHALYEGEIKASDALVGRLIEALDRAGDLDNTVFIVTGDHAEGLGESGRLGHGPIVWDSILSVPLVMRDFRVDIDAHRVKQTVGHVDLAPTVIDLTGVSHPSSTQGRSLLPAFAGAELEPVPYYAEVRAVDTKSQYEYDANLVAVYDWPFKLVDSNRGRELYDLEMSRDETEQASFDDNPGVADAMLALIEDFRSGGLEPRAQEALDDDTLEELRSLGYIQ